MKCYISSPSYLEPGCHCEVDLPAQKQEISGYLTYSDYLELGGSTAVMPSDLSVLLTQ